MAVVEKKQGKMSKGLIILLFIVGFFLASNSHTILSSYNKFIIQRTKEVSTITETLTTNEIKHLMDKQFRLAMEYDERKVNWLYKEINDGMFSIFSNDYTFMLDHPEYDSAKLEFTVIKYKVNGETVEFVNKSMIIQVHSKNGWQSK